MTIGADYVFVCEPLADGLVGLEVANDGHEAWPLSDACPIMAGFDL